MLNTFAGINGHLNLFVNSYNCNFTLIKQRYAGGIFCIMAGQARLTDGGDQSKCDVPDMMEVCKLRLYLWI